jgi:hypothetical protein
MVDRAHVVNRWIGRFLCARIGHRRVLKFWAEEWGFVIAHLAGEQCSRCQVWTIPARRPVIYPVTRRPTL